MRVFLTFLRISWSERKTNKWVGERIGVKEEGDIVKQIKGGGQIYALETDTGKIVMTSIENEIIGTEKEQHGWTRALI